MTETTLSITIPGQFRDLLAETVEAAVAKALAQVQRETPAPRITESPPLSSTNTGIELRPTDKTKAADLRIALLTGKIPEETGLLIDARRFAKLLSVSLATLWRLQAQQVIPPPIKLGHLTKWRLAEVIEWIEADCPPQRNWGYSRERSLSRNGK
jgi:predicted DNA-binding transcriptional regulator AlpA